MSDIGSDFFSLKRHEEPFDVNIFLFGVKDIKRHLVPFECVIFEGERHLVPFDLN